MISLRSQWDFRMLWAFLSGSAKLFVLLLVVGSAYSICLLIRTVYCMHGAALPRDENEARFLFAKISRRLQNLRSFHGFLFLLFGVFCANEVILAVKFARIAYDLPAFDGVNVFEPIAAFAFFVLATLLMLHIAEWVVSNRVPATIAPEKQDSIAANDFKKE